MNKIAYGLPYLSKLFSSGATFVGEYSKEAFEKLSTKDMDQRRKKFIENVIPPLKRDSDYWEAYYATVGIIQGGSFFALIAYGYLNVEKIKTFSLKKMIVITPNFELTLSLFPMIIVVKQVVKSVSIY